MTKVRLRCPLGGECGYETVPLEYDQANQQVEGHMQWAHSSHPCHNAPAFDWRELIKFLGATWSEGETVSQFVCRLKAAAARCDFSVQCPACRTVVSYSDSLVMQKLVASLSLREQQVRKNTDTLNWDSREGIVGAKGESWPADGAEEGEKEEVLIQEETIEKAPEEAQPDAAEETPDKAQEEAQDMVQEVVEDRSVLDDDMQDLRITNIESVTPVPARKSSKYSKGGKKEATFNCVKCGTYHYSRASLRGHYSLKHYKARLRSLIKEDTQCPICHKSFTKPNSAIIHIGTVHKKVEKFLEIEEKNANKKSRALHIEAAQNLVGKDSNKISSVFITGKICFLLERYLHLPKQNLKIPSSSPTQTSTTAAKGIPDDTPLPPPAPSLPSPQPSPESPRPVSAPVPESPPLRPSISSPPSEYPPPLPPISVTTPTFPLSSGDLVEGEEHHVLNMMKDSRLLLRSSRDIFDDSDSD